MISKILAEILNYKWFLVAYIVLAIAFCAWVYIKTDRFSWRRGRLRAFALLFDLNKPGQIAFALIMSRFILVCCLLITGGCSGLWDLLALELITVAVIIVSSDIGAAIQIVSFGAVFVIGFLEDMFFSYYKTVNDSISILLVVLLFITFGILFSAHQSLMAYSRLLEHCARRFKSRYDTEASRKQKEYEKDNNQKEKEELQGA